MGAKLYLPNRLIDIFCLVVKLSKSNVELQKKLLKCSCERVKNSSKLFNIIHSALPFVLTWLNMQSHA